MLNMLSGRLQSRVIQLLEFLDISINISKWLSPELFSFFFLKKDPLIFCLWDICLILGIPMMKERSWLLTTHNWGFYNVLLSYTALYLLCLSIEIPDFNFFWDDSDLAVVNWGNNLF